MSFNENDIARDAAGRFDEKNHTAPEVSLGAGSAARATQEQMRYRILVDGEPATTLARGEDISRALRTAQVYREANPDATLALEGWGSEDNGAPTGESVSLELHGMDEGRMVGWHNGDALLIDDLDPQGLTLADVEMRHEPYIDTAPEFEIDSLIAVEDGLSNADMNISFVSARTDEDNPDIVNVDITLHENFLWDAGTGIEDDDEREAALDERRALLDEYQHIVDEVFQDSFNANITDVPDDWDSAMVEVRVPVPRSHFTESLVIEKTYNAMAKYRNETDPGTYGSPYVMAEVWARIEKAQAQSRQELDFDRRLMTGGR